MGQPTASKATRASYEGLGWANHKVQTNLVKQDLLSRQKHDPQLYNDLIDRGSVS